MSLQILGIAQTPTVSRLVRIDALTERDCAIETDQLPDCDKFDLWIGAVGPVRSSVSARRQTSTTVMFDQPLDHEVLLHFLAP